MSTVVITGANRGIGLELARAHTQRGDRVIAGCRVPADASDLAALSPVAIHPVDVGDETSIEAFRRERKRRRNCECDPYADEDE